MEWHINVVVKKMPYLGKALLQTGASRKSPHGFDREMCPLVGQTIITPSFSLVFSSARDTKQLEIHAEL